MNTAASFYACMAAALLLVLSSACTASAVTCSGDESLGDNVCFGTGALGSYSSDTGGNSAFGYEALSSDTTGDTNTAAGDSALLQNTTGSENTAIGASALGENTTGEGNTAIGVSALDYNKSGSNNIGIGAGGGSSHRKQQYRHRQLRHRGRVRHHSDRQPSRQFADRHLHRWHLQRKGRNQALPCIG